MQQETPKNELTFRTPGEVPESPAPGSQSVFRPRPPGESLILKGEGHVSDFPPLDPRIRALQIIGSSAIEGIAPSPELAALAGVDRASLGLEDI
jgi:hypothetical protein